MTEMLRTGMKRYNHLVAEIDAAYHEAALKLGLSDSAMLILYTVCDNGGECLLSDIIRLSGASKQTINSALRKLERDGVVYLESFSGKKKKVCLTETGRTVAGGTVERLIRVENEICGSWSKEDWERYLALTQKYLTDFKAGIKAL